VVEAQHSGLGRRARVLVLVEALSVGIPFGVFKVLCGVHLGGVAGWGLVALGGVDLLLNALNAVTVAVAGRRVAPVCLFHALAWAIAPAFADVGTALDALQSFALVAVMIGAHQLMLLPPASLDLWNAAVVLNVLGAGVLRLAQALETARPVPAPAPLDHARPG
jgi:hypothetical protein